MRRIFLKNNILRIFFIILILLINLMLIFSCNKENKLVIVEPQPPFTEEDLRFEDSLKSYLQYTYPCQIINVTVGGNSINIIGKCASVGEYYLEEIPPFEDVTRVNYLSSKIKLPNSSFDIEVERFMEKDGVVYDRLLSKWAIFELRINDCKLISHAHHADNIFPLQKLLPLKLNNKKGIGGIFPNQYILDFASLNIGSATINICITQFMRLNPKIGDIAHQYGGRTYYIDEKYIENTLDTPLLEAAKRNMVVAAIILLEPASKSVDLDFGALLQHPNYINGVYSMPNMTSLESVNCYAAALDFLAKRYCTADNYYGRISHWIMHNEVDGGLEWANMGIKPVKVFTDTYIKSMRMCYNIVRQYDINAEVFASFSHSWTAISNPSWYSCKEMLDLLNTYSKVEGDFQWGLAYHSYPQDLGNPCTWDDPNATFSMDTQFVTFKNLEVLNKWALDKDNKYRGEIKRSVWLSEAGVNSRSYSDEDLIKQAAGLAFAWKKIKALEGIDGIQWHNWFDNEAEGACLGLRKYLNSSHNGEAKPVWHAYRKAGTNEEDEYFEQFLPIIGISDWDIIEKF